MSNFRGATALTGGATGALDAIDGDDLSDGDACVVVTAANSYVYVLDADSAAGESSPAIIAPDTNPGDKRWILTSVQSAGGGSITSRFKAKLASDYNLAASGTWAKIPWDTKVYDGDTEFNTSLNRFVAKADGLYHFDCTIKIATPGTTLPAEFQLQLNGSTGNYSVNGMGVGTVSHNRYSWSGDFEMSVDDYLEIWGHQYAGSVKAVAADDSRFSGHRVQ